VTTEQVQAQPAVAEQIRAWLPEHAHLAREVTGTHIWTWTTPAGVWGVTLGGGMGGGFLNLIGPGGQWNFGVGEQADVTRLRGVLIVLGAIGGAS
jgi:hypothetical protein